MEKKMIPYSVHLPKEHYIMLKKAAKGRKASSIVRDAIMTFLSGGDDAFKNGYNKAVRDAAKVVYDCPEAQMIAIKGKDLGAILTEQIEMLEMKQS